ncbi:hypothetical protein PG993_009299 [Apiospora rasikravindrae]|uniref:Uncharacterized protein n=1 Tax=Apiospora rasikravindrae TaxID=990691 RepID=A0ABR1SJ01_9PEZI
MAHEKQRKPGASPTYQNLGTNKTSIWHRGREFGHSFGWIWEAVSALVGSGCMAAVVVILWRMQGRPLSSWTFPINLSSSIAAFVTAAKATSLLIVASCLSQSKWRHFQQRSRLRDFEVFDEASRGPLGSLKLLWCLRARWGLAILGALLTIAAVSIDTLAQEMVNLEERDEMIEDPNAKFWVTDAYIGGAKAMTPSFPVVAEGSTIDTRMQGAIYRGLYGIESSPAFSCQSRCEWGSEVPYVTLGLTSRCEDVTQSTLSGGEHREQSGFDSVLLSTPGGLHLNYSDARPDWHTVFDLTAGSLVEYQANSSHNDLQPCSPDFARVAVLRPKNSPDGPKWSELGSNNIEIFECQLSLAAYEYAGLKASGNDFTAEKVAIRPLKPGHGHNGDIDRNKWLKSQEPTFATFNTSGLPSFNVSLPDLGALGDFFPSGLFSGMTLGGPMIPWDSSGLGVVLSGNVDIGQTFANIAQSMTHQLHSAYPDIRAISGKSAKTVVFVRVEWQWLAAPLTIQVVAMLLFLAIMVMTRGQGAILWKSSPTAVLYHNVESPNGPDAVLATEMRSVEHLRRTADDVTVRCMQSIS